MSTEIDIGRKPCKHEFTEPVGIVCTSTSRKTSGNPCSEPRPFTVIRKTSRLIAATGSTGLAYGQCLPHSVFKRTYCERHHPRLLHSALDVLQHPPARYSSGEFFATFSPGMYIVIATDVAATNHGTREL